jgi:hypothetical protein
VPAIRQKVSHGKPSQRVVHRVTVRAHFKAFSLNALLDKPVQDAGDRIRL